MCTENDIETTVIKYIFNFLFEFFLPLDKIQIWLISHIHQTKYLLSHTLHSHYTLGNWIFFSISGFTKLNIDKKYNFIWYYLLIVNIFRTIDEMESSHSSLVSGLVFLKIQTLLLRVRFYVFLWNPQSWQAAYKCKFLYPGFPTQHGHYANFIITILQWLFRKPLWI